VQGQLATQPTDFGGSAELVLSGWRPQSGRGGARCLETRHETGRRLLTVKLRGEGSNSWRTQLLLKPGEYQFVGKAKLEGFSAASDDRRAGAGLRISGGEFTDRLTEDTDWTAVQYTFVIHAITPITLVCEAKGETGEASFDIGSLKLVRR
jgi:hypothetical protein